MSMETHIPAKALHHWTLNFNLGHWHVMTNLWQLGQAHNYTDGISGRCQDLHVPFTYFVHDIIVTL